LPRSFRQSLAHWYGFYGDAIVVSREHQGGWLRAPLSADYESVVAAVDGVRRVETLRVLQGQTYRGDRIAVAGLGDGYIDRALSADRLQHGREQAASSVKRGEAAMISENFALHYGLRVGDEVSLPTPTGDLSLPVVAVVPDFVSDRGSVLVTRNLLHSRWRDRLVNYFAVFLDTGSNVEAFRQAVARATREDAATLSVLSLVTLVAQIDDAIAAAFADIDALQVLVLLITIAGIVDLAVSNVLDRRRLHAVLRIAGTTDRGILQIVACEGGIIGISAAVVGVAIGGFAAWIWTHFAYPVLVGYVLHLNFAWTNALLCFAITTVTAIAAGSAAGYLSLRESPVAAVRAE
jgi:putative ABC transport system permease protein